jgi:hypothetical protein
MRFRRQKNLHYLAGNLLFCIPKLCFSILIKIDYLSFPVGYNNADGGKIEKGFKLV